MYYHYCIWQKFRQNTHDDEASDGDDSNNNDDNGDDNSDDAQINLLSSFLYHAISFLIKDTSSEE